MWLKNQTWNTSPSRQEVADEVEWNLWSVRQPPFNLLEKGQTVFLATLDTSGRSVISWETEVTMVTAVPYASKRDAWKHMRDTFPQFDDTLRQFLVLDYTNRAPDAGWMLGWDYRPIRQVEVLRPDALKFRPNGWRPLNESHRQLRKWGIIPADWISDRRVDPRERGLRHPPRQQDPLRRRAVELRAMNVARRYLINECGWLATEIFDTSATHPYDFECRRGNRNLRVEVKGVSGPLGQVTLTRREVEHARSSPCPVMLVIVAGIGVTDTVTGPKATGGTLEVWNPWHVDEGRLAASAYAYEPPKARGTPT